MTDVEELNAFTFGFWPFRVLRRYWGDCTYGPFDAPAPGSITDSEGNKLVVRLRGNEVLAVKDMARQLRLDKRFGTHWFYQQLSLSLQANGVDRDQLLELVAATVGGTLTQTDLGVEVRFNPTVFAKRAARTFEYVERHFTGSDRGSRKARASVRFEVEVFQTISPDVLEEAFRGQYSTVTVKIERDSKLWVLAVEAARLLDESISSSLDFERDWEYEIRAWDCLVSVIGWFRHNGTLTQVHF